MNCRINELRDKQVVSVKDGAVLGYVSDVELDIQNGNLVSIVIPGRNRGLGLLGREEDTIIPWENIEVIGNDTILVKFEFVTQSHKKQNFKIGFFG